MPDTLHKILYIAMLFSSTGFFTGCQGLVRGAIYPAPKGGPVPVVEKGTDTLVELPNGNRVVKAVLTKKSDKIVIFFHGNGCTITCDVETAQMFVNNGYSTLLVEYPGYGISARYKTTEQNIYSDAEAMVRHVQKTYNIADSHIIMYGQSLGSGVAVELAKRGIGSKLILISPFTSIVDVGAAHYPSFLARALIRDIYDNASKAKDIKLPVLIIHGTKDSIIPYSMGVTLSKTFKDATLLSLQGADHNDIYYFFNDEVWKNIFDFVK